MPGSGAETWYASPLLGREPEGADHAATPVRVAAASFRGAYPQAVIRVRIPPHMRTGTFPLLSREAIGG
jgi:hypothetical protein